MPRSSLLVAPSSEMSLPPAASILSMALKPSVMLRLNLSRFQTRSASASPRSIRSITESQPWMRLALPSARV